MFLNPFRIADGLARAAVHTALTPVRMLADPVLSGAEVDPFESVSNSGRRIKRALADAARGLDGESD